jgi:hypothetical protein
VKVLSIETHFIWLYINHASVIHVVTAAAILKRTKQDRPYTFNVTLRRLRKTIFAVKKAISSTYSECVCFLDVVIPHAPHFTVICVLSDSTSFFYVIS